MRRYVSFAIITIALLTLIVWAVSQFVQPILPRSINSGLVLFFAALLSVIGLVAGFKDIVELILLLFKSDRNNQNDKPSQSAQTVVHGGTYIGSAESVSVQTDTYEEQKLEFHAHVAGSVQDLVQTERGTVTIIYQDREQRTVSFLTPPRPSHDLVGRDNLLDNLKQQLFTGGSLALSALNGLPGVGKTALAMELAYDPEVLEHFGDGVLWAGLGRCEPDVLAHQETWGRALGIPADEIGKLSSIEDRGRAIHTAIGTRRMLLVVDDAWQPEAALAFKVGGPNCAHLVTTRLPEVALRFASTEATVVHELSEDDGLTLLARLAPAVVAAEPDEARELVQAVGGLPLALILMGNYLRVEAHSRQPRRLRKALEQLREAQERLKLAEPQVPLEPHPSLPMGTPLSLLVSIGISDEALDDETRRTFYALSVFPPKPNNFSEEAARFVSGTSFKILDTLNDYALLESSGPGRHTLHQAIADYARMKLTDEAAYKRMGEFFSNLLAPYRKPYAYFDAKAHADIPLEEENIKATLNWYQQRSMWPEFISLVTSFCSFLTNTSRWQEVIKWGKEAVDAAEKTDNDFAKAHLCSYVLAWPLWMCGEYQEARDHCHRGMVAAQNLSSVDKQIYLCFATHNLHKTALQECQNTEDRDLVRRCLREMKLSADQCVQFAQQTENSDLFLTLLGMAYGDMGYADLKCGKYREAEKWHRQRLDLLNKKKRIHVAARWLDIAIALLGQKNHAESERLLEEALPIAQEHARDDITAEILFALTRIDRERGNLTRAQAREEKAQDLWNKAGLDRSPFVYILDKPESCEA